MTDTKPNEPDYKKLAEELFATLKYLDSGWDFQKDSQSIITAALDRYRAATEGK